MAHDLELNNEFEWLRHDIEGISNLCEIIYETFFLKEFSTLFIEAEIEKYSSLMACIFDRTGEVINSIDYILDVLPPKTCVQVSDKINKNQKAL